MLPKTAEDVKERPFLFGFVIHRRMDEIMVVGCHFLSPPRKYWHGFYLYLLFFTITLTTTYPVVLSFTPPLVRHRKIHDSRRVRPYNTRPSLRDVVNGIELGPYQEGRINVPRSKDQQYALYYRIYNAPSSSMTKCQAPPLVVCHGGPSLPSQYLYPIVPLLDDRPIIFYDQLGCGKSDQPGDLSCYSIEQSVDDLNQLLLDVVVPMMGPSSSSSSSSSSNDEDHYSCPFHLYGHSYGGVLVYEYLQRCFHPLATPSNDQSSNTNKDTTYHHRYDSPQSVILSNTPTDLGRCNNDYDRLYFNDSVNFWKRHNICNYQQDGVDVPPSLLDAMVTMGKVWFGMDVVRQYKAQPLLFMDTDDEENDNDALGNRPSILVISASQDFAYNTSNEEAWKPLLSQPKAATTILDSNNSDDDDNESVLLQFVNFDDDCGHYPFYEQHVGETYGKVITEFLQHAEQTRGKVGYVPT